MIYLIFYKYDVHITDKKWGNEKDLKKKKKLKCSALFLSFFLFFFLLTRKWKPSLKDKTCYDILYCSKQNFSPVTIGKNYKDMDKQFH